MYRGFTPQMYILRAVSQDWRPVLLPAVALPLRFRDRNDMINCSSITNTLKSYYQLAPTYIRGDIY